MVKRQYLLFTEAANCVGFSRPATLRQLLARKIICALAGVIIELDATLSIDRNRSNTTPNNIIATISSRNCTIFIGCAHSRAAVQAHSLPVWLFGQRPFSLMASC